MADLSYSLGARNVLNKFYSVDRVIYVEGEDDITFWELMFNVMSHIKVKVEEAGGKDQLQARIEEICGDDADYFVAIDSDFDGLSGGVDHPYVLRTFGYSMENTIISGLVLQRVICHVAKVAKYQVPVATCDDWLDKLDESVSSLITYDAVNRMDGLGKAVVGKNCDRFLEESRYSCQLCEEKLSRHLRSLEMEISDEKIQEVEAYLEGREMRWLDLLRGHFLLSAAFRFVKATVDSMRSSVSMSRAMFFGSIMLAFEATFNQDHRQYGYYKSMLGDLPPVG